MLPLPARNFKITKEWIRDEIFERYSPPQSTAFKQPQEPQPSKPSQPSRTIIQLGGVALATILGIGFAIAWRVQQPYPSSPSPASQPASSK
jgi:hypothetical protein